MRHLSWVFHCCPGYNNLHFFLRETVLRSNLKPLWKSLPCHTSAICNSTQPDSMANITSYALMLHSCTNVQTLNQIHAHILMAGLHSNNYLGVKLVDLYAVFGNVEDARQVFEKMYKPKTFSWTTMLRGYARNGYFEEAISLVGQMDLVGMQLDNFTFPFALKACGGLSALQEGKQIHSRILKARFQLNVYVAASLVDMYTKCSRLEDARKVFDIMSERDVVSWTAIIGGYAQSKCLNEALILFHQMQLEAMRPDSVVLISVLSACTQLGALQQGKFLHNFIFKGGFESDVSLMNSLLDMYANCGEIGFAWKVFDKMCKRDVISWSTMVAGYAKTGDASNALNLFNQMLVSDIKPNFVTMVSVLLACIHLGFLQLGEGMHGYIIKSGLESNVSVETRLLDMYAKCGNMDNAYKMFSINPRRDVVSWSVMIAGYVRNKRAHEALKLFIQMQLVKMIPDSVTIVSVLQACAQMGALQQGKCLHKYIITSGLHLDVFVETGLIDMYGKCGSIDIARHLFDRLSSKDVVSWSAMIAVCGIHGHGKDALDVFTRMQQMSIQPNHATFVSVLSACSHAGLVDEGWHHFNSMSRDYHITPQAEHYACMVDLLGRAGSLEEAEDFILKMPIEPDTNIWGALLGACRIHCNVALGERVAKRLFDLSPSNAGYYVLLSNIYAAAGRWDDVAKMRVMMRGMDLTRTPGCSSIEVDNKVHEFRMEDIAPLV
ncbi:pentatricopeptide repeat-containing protein At1g11290, chloroplastic [Cryptomeria japonica]|uniref:pentatricopeptide repeat-containing protein At1g11290, chloroplastic n=1 Tax=Cryptomeria japonica TaxID=3369 RepID=UPI0027DAB1D3|nr:pentatricopeptide repeat-containing protein At1g11290, chloroplastic [Cryptomeria japonica]XP_057829290.2 pentatricopeptide repeat-containing protein At1g11290, chloroplastic [Cryptomeria japonica]